MIFLFDSIATEFTTGGMGSLSDPITCEVVEERNGEFELTMEYPVDGRHYADLLLRRLILAKPNPFGDPQPFRIYAISKPINGIVTVNAEHISYDMSGYAVKPFQVASIVLALQGLKSNSVVPCPFEFWTDKDVSTTYAVTKPSSMRSLLGGTEGSILDIYGKGEYEFDKYSVKLWTNRGKDRGVTIRYGKNLTDLRQEENCSDVYTAVYPFWFSEEDGLVTLDDFVVRASGTYDYERIMPLDLSDKWQEAPTKEMLEEAASKYITDNNIGVPKVNLDVSFVQLAQSEEYKNYSLLETVRLCDTVSVEFPKLGVSAKSKCVKTVYDVIADRYISIELGENTQNSLAKTISAQTAAINKSPADSNILKTAVSNATKLITGGLGGHVILHSSTGDNRPDEILIMDTDNINTARKVWRWNKDGLGYSSTGYNGDFGLAMTSDGKIVADFIQTGTLSANRIRGGVLTDDQGYNYWNLQTGEFRLSWNSSIGSGDDEVPVSDIVTDVTIQYAQGDSPTTSPTTGWSTDSPAWAPDKYIWQRTVTTSGGKQTISNVTCIQGAKGDTGTTGQRGTSTLKITTAPTGYTTQVDDYTPAYRVALSTVELQSGETPIVGDIIEYAYYHYAVGLVKDDYVYLGPRYSIRGATGAAGADAVTLRIDSSRGVLFKNNLFDTVLTVTIQKGTQNITDAATMRSVFGTGSYLQWYWRKLEDESWRVLSVSDSHISDEGFSLTITPDDVDEKIVFKCDLEV